ncbi:unnamed protein product [Phytomonas sp. EM1]|nr:unnamed protein product [Phytomonas sp. EM1]|eukprot:CCW65628.1 unnamed protein product [Phytomonas sp. isolate EM1]
MPESSDKSIHLPPLEHPEDATPAQEMDVHSGNALSNGNGDVKRDKEGAGERPAPRPRVILKVTITNIYDEAPPSLLPSATSSTTGARRCTAGAIFVASVSLIFRPLYWLYRILKWMLWVFFWGVTWTLLFMILAAFFDVSKSRYDTNRDG